MDRDAKVHTYILLEYIKSQGLICYPKILIIVVGWYSTVTGDPRSNEQHYHLDA